MSTKALLYPKGFEFMDPLPAPAGERPYAFAIQDGMDNFWKMARATVTMSLTVSGTTFGTTIGQGIRYDATSAAISSPMTLINGIGKDYRDDFASPLLADSAFIPDDPTPIGSDLLYGGVGLTFSGLMYFNATQCQPVIALTGGIVAIDTGWEYSWSITEPGVANQSTGNYLRVDGIDIPCWLQWSGSGVLAPDDGRIEVSTTDIFHWP